MSRSFWIHSMAIFCLAAGLPACGSDDPVAPQTATSVPAPTPPDSTVDEPRATIWERVFFSDLLPEPPPGCTQAERFYVNKNGTWNWDFCTDENSGTVTSEELAEIDRRVLAINEAGIGDEICLELSYEGRRILEIRFPPDRDERVHDMGRQGSCFRSDAGRVNDLEDYVDGLRVKYTGFTASN